MSGRFTKGPVDQKGATVMGRSPWWVFPAFVWMLILLVVPIAMVIVVSFCRRGTFGGIVFDFTGSNFVRAMEPLYLRIYWESVQFALLTSGVCLLLGFPTAWMMATAAKRWRNALLILIMIPFLTNFIIRAYGIKVLLGRTGPLNGFLVGLGLTDGPLPLTDSWLAVWFGMVTNYLPFMVLPLYSALEKFDFRLLEAAFDLGARGHEAFRKVILPLVSRPMAAGFTLVFIPAFGEFIIPDFLGGARQMLIGNLLTEQFLKARDWPFGSAIALVMFAVVFTVFGIQSLVSRGIRHTAKEGHVS